MRRTISEDFGSYTQGLYTVANNVWNKRLLVNGADFTQSVSFNTDDLTRDVTFRWDWPVTVQDAVYAYPSIVTGYAPWTESGSTALTTRVDRVKSFTVDYDLSISGDTDDFNVALEFWLTRKAHGTGDDITTEVMVWLHNGALAPAGQAALTYGNGPYKAGIWVRDGMIDNSGQSPQTWRYIAFTPDKDQLRGTVDLHDVLVVLARHGLVSGRDYISGFEFGAEVVANDGSLTFHHLDQKLARHSITMGADTIDGTARRDNLAGMAGADTIAGMGGQDWLLGEAGQDRLKGGAGADRLVGGLGRDHLTGGDGADHFDFNALRETATGSARDVIHDFQRGLDRVALGGMDANANRDGNQAFRWIGQDAFDPQAGQLRVLRDAAGVVLAGDVNGDGRADFQIALLGLTALAQADIVL